MNAGQLKHKIIVQKIGDPPTIVVDGMEKPNWIPFKNVWAARKGLSGRILYAAMAQNAQTDIIYTIRYIDGVDNTMSILDGNDTYYIRSALDKYDKKIQLEITAYKVEPSA